MKCQCGCVRDKVIETRRLDDMTWRRRECFDCGARWWTSEKRTEHPPPGLHKISRGVAVKPAPAPSAPNELFKVWQ